jgi:RNA polymerase sigma-70 factor (ECF subfamily)
MLSYSTEVGETTKMDAVPERSGLEDRPSTMTGADVESGLAACEGMLIAFTQAAEGRRAQLLWQAQRMTNNREEAEDIVQEALFKAFKNLPQFRGESQMGTWLGAIVQNTGREWLRKRKGRVYLPLEHCNDIDNDSIYDAPDPGQNPEQCCEHGEMDSIVRSEIDKLNSVCKRAMQMYALDQLSQLEVANELGVDVITIKSRIFHGKRMLKHAIRLRTDSRDDSSRSMEPAF